MSWTLSNDDDQFYSDVKEYEGTIAFQTKMGYYKNSKFWVYKDSLGLPTIGYGHLVRNGENFSQGLTEEQANIQLQKDSQAAFNDAKAIYQQYKMNAPESIQRVLWQMVFQMGKASVLGFNNTLTHMAKGDYSAAAAGMRNSKWYRQTTSRAEKLARIVESA